jgi:hypothetical protein
VSAAPREVGGGVFMVAPHDQTVRDHPVVASRQQHLEAGDHRALGVDH